MCIMTCPTMCLYHVEEQNKTELNWKFPFSKYVPGFQNSIQNKLKPGKNQQNIMHGLFGKEICSVSFVYAWPCEGAIPFNYKQASCLCVCVCQCPRSSFEKSHKWAAILALVDGTS